MHFYRGGYMFKIGEFSKLTQVSIRMLRHYDEVGLLKPAKIDTFTNYRLYTAEQIPTLNKIIFLRDLGFSITEITTALKTWHDDTINQALTRKRFEIENSIQVAQEKLAKMDQAEQDILQKKIAIHYNVTIKSVPSYQVLSLRRVMPDYYAEGLLWKDLSAFAGKNNIAVSNDTFTIYHDIDYKETDVDIEICAPVPKMCENEGEFVYQKTEAVPFMACTMVYGPFENIAGAFLTFANWLQEHNQYKMAGTSRQIVHRGPWNEENVNDYLTEIQVPLKKHDKANTL